MYTSRSTPSTSVQFPATREPAQPVVYILTDDCSERAALKNAVSDAGFRAEALPAADAHRAAGPLRAQLPGGGRPPTSVVCRRRAAGHADDLPGGAGRRRHDRARHEGGRHRRAAKAGQSRTAGGRGTPCSGRQRPVAARAIERRRLQDRYDALSQRERQVVALVVTGLLNKQIAYELGISEITVKAHRGRMMRKMNARSLVSLVQMANRLRLAPASGQDGNVAPNRCARTRVAITQDRRGRSCRARPWSTGIVGARHRPPGGANA